MKIYLGAGSHRLEGFTHIDIVPLPGIDYVCDITKGLPFEDNSIDEVYSQDFLEHIPQDKAVFVINEICRVLKPGGRMEHKVPNAGTRNDFASPTHLSHWNLTTFDFFDVNSYRFDIDTKFNGFNQSGFKKILADEENPNPDIDNGKPQNIHVIYEKV